jgi:hypothetical protein
MERCNKTATFLFLMKGGGPVELQQLFVSTRNKVIQTTMQPVYITSAIFQLTFMVLRNVQGPLSLFLHSELYLLAQGVLHPVAVYV